MKGLIRVVLVGFVLFAFLSHSYAAEIKVATKTEKDSGKRPEYSIVIEYPRIESGVAKDEENGFNDYVKTYVDGKASEFKASIIDELPTLLVKNTPKEALVNTLNIKYNIVHSTGRFISVEFSVSQYHAGSVHPIEMIDSVNYDFAKKRPIFLSDIFKTGSNYLSKLSAICMRDLSKQSEVNDDIIKDWVKDGAAGMEDNYKTFLLTGDYLVIIFNVYQVAPYFAGPQKVEIPYSEIQGFVSPDGPVM